MKGSIFNCNTTGVGFFNTIIHLIQWCRKYQSTNQMQIEIVTDKFKNATISPTSDFIIIIIIIIINVVIIIIIIIIIINVVIIIIIIIIIIITIIIIIINM